MPGCVEEPQLPASPTSSCSPPAPGGPQIHEYTSEPGHRGCPSPPPLLSLPSGGASALPKPLATAPWLSSPALCHSSHVPCGCSIPFIWGKIPPGAVSRVCLWLPPPPCRPPARTQVPLPPFGSSQHLHGHRGPMAPSLPWGDTGHSPAGSAGRGFPPGSSWRWRGFSSTPASSGRTWLRGGRAAALGPRCPARLRLRLRFLTVPATFAGANCQEGACDAALFPHRLHSPT